MTGRAKEQGEPARVQMLAEHRGVPVLSIVLGYGAMAPLAAAALLAWVAPGDVAGAAFALALLWGGLLLAFFAGVRRGVSFRTEGGPAILQLVLMGWLFALAFAALLPLPAPLRAALVLAGFATLLIADRPAAKAGRQPLHFARLRPPQMALAAASLSILLVYAFTHGV